MTKSKNNTPRVGRLQIAFGVILLLTGFFGGLFTNYHLNFKFQFRDTIEPANFLSVICTVILAWMVGIIWNRQQYAEHTSKEVLTKRLEELQTFSSEFAIRAAGEKFMWTDATSAIKRMRTSLNSVCRLAEDIELVVETRFKADVENRIENLDDLITNTPAYWPTTKKVAPVTVSENRIVFSRERALEVAVAFDDLRHAITSLELAINRG
jgi:hypothetical protein